MTHASLFSGIGGFDIAAEWAGWENAFNCEIDPFCLQVLKYHFPNAVQYEDIKTTDFTVWRGKIDVLTGGFPCQPFSTAGKRKGTADNRYLWPEMLRAIREIGPRWVVGENVFGIVNWSRGLVFERVHADLEDAGYEVQAFILPACSVGAPHLRYRVWFVAHRSDAGAESKRGREDSFHEYKPIAYSDSNRQGIGEDKQIPVSRSIKQPIDCISGKNGFTTNTNSQRWKKCDIARKSERTNIAGIGSNEIQYRWSNFPTQSPVCSRDDGFPIPMDGITFPKWRAESIKAYGNAIVPQVAYRIFDTINKYESL